MEERTSGEGGLITATSSGVWDSETRYYPWGTERWSSGNVVLAKGYEPYGEVMNSAGTASTVYGYTAEWTDNTGKVYLRLLALLSILYTPYNVNEILFISINC